MGNLLNYFNPKQPASFSGANTFAKTRQTSKQQGCDWLQKKDCYTLHLPVRKRFFQTQSDGARIIKCIQILLILALSAHEGGRVVCASGSKTSVSSLTPTSATIYDAYTSIIKKKKKKKDFSAFKKYNCNFRWVFAVIDVFSRKSFVEVLKNKSAQCVTKTFEKILKFTGLFFYLWTDCGFEFFNASFRAFLKNTTFSISAHTISTSKRASSKDLYER